MHDHGHSHREKNRARLGITLALTLFYMLAEVIGGYMADSLALMADAGHMLSDAAALALSLFAIWIAARPATPRHSYGFYRAEILAALANGVTLVVISLIIFKEAYERLGQPHKVEGPLMMGIAVGGLVVNLIGMALLYSGRDQSLNIRGAWLHLLTDALGSVAALGAGALVWLFGWELADPVASILIGILVIYSSWELLKESVAILMQSTPNRLNMTEVEQALAGAPGVCGVHDLHVWTLTGGMESLSAHVVLRDGHSQSEVLSELRRLVHNQFGIDHITIQIEPNDNQKCESPF
jgi:cobalt-zinc-cadmium efflux system protein